MKEIEEELTVWVAEEHVGVSITDERRTQDEDDHDRYGDVDVLVQKDYHPFYDDKFFRFCGVTYKRVRPIHNDKYKYRFYNHSYDSIIFINEAHDEMFEVWVDTWKDTRRGTPFDTDNHFLQGRFSSLQEAHQFGLQFDENRNFLDNESRSRFEAHKLKTRHADLISFTQQTEAL